MPVEFAKKKPLKILVVVSNYPHVGHQFSGSFNERTVSALRKLSHCVEVLAPRPYAPRVLSLIPGVQRWKAYAAAPAYELRSGVQIHRPSYVQIPRSGLGFWMDKGAFLACRRTVRERHNAIGFDAILSFDLLGAGGLAWRLGQDLRIPACGWATGDDVRVDRSSSLGQVTVGALKNLNIVFYQTRELREKAAGLLHTTFEELSSHRHIVLPRGIPLPPTLNTQNARERVRQEWGVHRDQVVVLNIGRIDPRKGIAELIKSVSLASEKNDSLVCVIVGSKPEFDATSWLLNFLRDNAAIARRVKLLPACSPDRAWEYLCGADIFAFASQYEGMPNSLLEAMVMELPSVAFGIPAITELNGDSGALIDVPPFDPVLFAKALLELAGSPKRRIELGRKGRSRVLSNFMVERNMDQALRHITREVNALHLVSTC